MSTSGRRRAAASAVRRLLPRREALPLLLLLLALSSVFVFGGDRGHFYRIGHHNDASALTLSLSTNLSAEHRFLLFERRYLDKDNDGEPAYETYSRFPIGSYALVRLAILPFGDDIPRAIHAARLLMLACFAAAAVLAWLTLVRLTGDRLIALTATLIAFSSYFLLYYSDWISAEGSTNLIGVMLAFHGMAVFVQEGRFRQLLLKTAAAILLGWHVTALIAPFVLIGLGSELVRERAGGALPGDPRRAFTALVRSRYLLYGGFAVLTCVPVLGWNFVSEYLALGGEVPSLESLLKRTALGDSSTLAESGHLIDWGPFLRGQLARIGTTAIPFAALQQLGPEAWIWPYAPWLAATGAVAFGASLAGLIFLRHRMLTAALLVAGWCWALPFRSNVGIHDFETVFHVGVALVLLLQVQLGLRRLPGQAAVLPCLAAAAMLAFVLSAVQMSRVGNEGDAAEAHRALSADLSAMRAETAGASVAVRAVRLPRAVPSDGAGRWMLNYYFTGAFVQHDGFASEPAWNENAAMFDYAALPVNIGGSLTPENRRTFLYRASALPGLYDAISADKPALRGFFDVRLDGRRLTYTRSGCIEEDTAARFFLHLVPIDPADLPAERRRFGFDNLDFSFREHGARFAGNCVALIDLPGYAIASVRTGQFEGNERPWGGGFRVGAPDQEDRYAAIAAGDPALHGPFDVYLDGRTLAYVRDGCSAEDTEPGFFLHIVPAAPGDLPAERRRSGFDNLDFRFWERGERSAGRCVAAVELPEYDIALVRTGQHEDGARLWEGVIAFGGPGQEDRYTAIAAGEPVLRAAFDVHLDGRTLHYLRSECSAEDAAPRFFLHVVPADAADLPDERRRFGFDNLDFAFADRGLRFGERCMASILLPEYGVARVRTGQHEGGERLWEGKFALPAGE